jgi:hypothetical protein
LKNEGVEAVSIDRKRKSRNRKWWIIGSISLILVIILAGVTYVVTRPKYTEAPEAQKILEAQRDLDFGILIPAYLPNGFDRENVAIKVTQSGPSGKPSVELTYKGTGWGKAGAAIYVTEWMPANPELEILSGSRPIETRWGKGYLFVPSGDNLGTVWVDVGPLRVSISTNKITVLKREDLLRAADTLGLASDLQVFHFENEPLRLTASRPSPPFQVLINDEGIQELNLTITPGGYTPMRFAVKKDIPVVIVFRQLGQVGCGNVLIFPSDPKNPVALTLRSLTDVQTLEFTPKVSGDFQFMCANNHFRGVMTVQEQ